MGDNKISEAWPDYLMIRDTGLHDDAGGLGQHIFTTAGAGYEKVKYVRADLAHLHGEAVPVGYVDLANLRAGLPSEDCFYIAWQDDDTVPVYLHPQPAELSEVSGDSGELVSDIYKVASTPGMTPIDLADWIRDVLMRNIYALAATGKQQVGEVQGSREQFEAWAKSNNYSSLKWPDGAYAEEAMQLAWKAWQHLASRQPVGAQGIDLGQLKVEVQRLRKRTDPVLGEKAIYVGLDAVLALLDGRDAGMGVGS